MDNRAKTLLDALKMPDDEAALPSSATPTADESPFSCLLEDDGPITNIDIKTAHRLEPAAQDPDEVVFLLRARTGATDVVVGNLAFLKCWRKRRTLASSYPYLLPRRAAP